ncbi:MAG: hypothetical protein ACLP9L_38600 [Thermoguttaceae bacterium]
MPAERQTTTQTPLKSTAKSEAPSPNHLPAATVAAPPGTKEGDTRILSITDRRLDELQRPSNPVALQRKSPQTAEKPSEDPGGWRSASPRQDPTETANHLREIDR